MDFLFHLVNPRDGLGEQSYKTVLRTQCCGHPGGIVVDSLPPALDATAGFRILLSGKSSPSDCRVMPWHVGFYAQVRVKMSLKLWAAP